MDVYETCWVVYHSKEWEVKVSSGWRTQEVYDQIINGSTTQVAKMIYNLNSYKNGFYT